MIRSHPQNNHATHEYLKIEKTNTDRIVSFLYSPCSLVPGGCRNSNTHPAKLEPIALQLGTIITRLPRLLKHVIVGAAFHSMQEIFFFTRKFNLHVVVWFLSTVLVTSYSIFFPSSTFEAAMHWHEKHILFYWGVCVHIQQPLPTSYPAPTSLSHLPRHCHGRQCSWRHDTSPLEIIEQYPGLH